MLGFEGLNTQVIIKKIVGKKPELKMQSMRTIKRRYRALALRPPKKYMLPTLHSFRDTSNDRSGGPCCLVPNSDAVDVVDIANAKL